MVVDDERDITEIFKTGLERNGFLVDVFEDPLEALSHYKPDFYDLLLIDVRMPTMSGFELLKEILKVDSSARACFITAFEIQFKEDTKDRNCIIRKPISLKELVVKIRHEIDGQVLR